MKGFFIVVFALFMFAIGNFCCEKKHPDSSVSGVPRDHLHNTLSSQRQRG